MTNEEKAREIGEFFESPYVGALEMAEWKDEQLRKFIESNKQPVLASDTDDTVVGYSIDTERLFEWLELF